MNGKMEAHPQEKRAGGLPLLFSLFLGLALLAHAAVLMVFGGAATGLADWEFVRGDLSRHPDYAAAVANLYRIVAISAAGAGDAMGRPTDDVSEHLELFMEDGNGPLTGDAGASADNSKQPQPTQTPETAGEGAYWQMAETGGRDSAAATRAELQKWLSLALEADGQEGRGVLGVAVASAAGDLQKDYPVTVPFDEATGEPAVPAGWRLEAYWDGETLTAANEKILSAYQNTAYAIRPLEDGMRDLRIAVVTRSWERNGLFTSWFFGNDTLYRAARSASVEHAITLIALGELLLGLPLTILPLVFRRRRMAGAAAFAKFTGWFLVEFKALCAVADLWLVYQLARETLWYVGSDPATGMVVCSLVGGFLFVVPGCVLFTDLVHNKGNVFRNNLFNLCRKAIHALTARSDVERGLMGRAWLAAVPGILGCAVLSFFWVTNLSWYGGLGALVILGAMAMVTAAGVLLLWLCGRTFRTVGAYTAQVHELAQGRPAQALPLKPGDTFAAAEQDLMNLQEGVRRAVDQAVNVQLQAERVQLQSERMKVELIANVSHDLKTPLTSVVNYADLLCEEPLEAPADHYAQVLREKAYRLKTMVQDVFDVSKAASGALPLQPELIDLSRLIGQTLADMDERITASGLEFKVDLAPGVLVFADGAKLYRVFQNLLDNALKYAMPASRVYVDLARQEGQAAARVRNVSARALDIPPEELVERFVRGDANRTDGGSGLGLSIAKTFAEACGGAFELRFDADLVTAAVRLPLAPEDGEKRHGPAADAAADVEGAAPAEAVRPIPGGEPGASAAEGGRKTETPPPQGGDGADGAAETAGQPFAPQAAGAGELQL